MVGAVSISGWFTDSYSSCPSLFLDTISSSRLNIKGNGDLGFCRNSMGKRQKEKLSRALDLSSSFLDAWYEWRLSAKMISCFAYGFPSKQRKRQYLSVVDELGGQYEDTFNDVKAQIVNYFTYKATRTVLHQLYEMNPSQYMWLHNFIATHERNDGKRFLQNLVKEKQELAERVMITRLHLYGKWIKICDHAEIYNGISDENLNLMRARLMETVIWPSEDTNTENKE